jgi:hypothetical protein
LAQTSGAVEPGTPEDAIHQVIGSQLDVHLSDTAMELLGPYAELSGFGAIDAGRWAGDWLCAQTGTDLWADTNRSVIAEQMLRRSRGHVDCAGDTGETA